MKKLSMPFFQFYSHDSENNQMNHEKIWQLFISYLMKTCNEYDLIKKDLKVNSTCFFPYASMSLKIVWNSNDHQSFFLFSSVIWFYNPTENAFLLQQDFLSDLCSIIDEYQSFSLCQLIVKKRILDLRTIIDDKEFCRSDSDQSHDQRWSMEILLNKINPIDPRSWLLSELNVSLRFLRRTISLVVNSGEISKHLM